MGKNPPKYDYLLDSDEYGEFCVIPLSSRKGEYFAKIDPEDFEDISQFRWFPNFCDKKDRTKASYACRNLPKGKKEFLHRRILKISDGALMDHKDRDGLNCRKYNLRVANHAENARNMKRRGGSSKYKGVSWKKSQGVWTSQIKYEGKAIHLGVFPKKVVDGVDVGEIEAAKRYDTEALKFFSEFALLNFPEERNIVKLKDGYYKMSYLMSEQDKKRIEKRITDIQDSVDSGDMINEILKVRDLQEIIDMCRFLGCGVGEIIVRIRNYKGEVSDKQSPTMVGIIR
jgi:hypothetical protein